MRASPRQSSIGHKRISRINKDIEKAEKKALLSASQKNLDVLYVGEQEDLGGPGHVFDQFEILELKFLTHEMHKRILSEIMRTFMIKNMDRELN